MVNLHDRRVGIDQVDSRFLIIGRSSRAADSPVDFLTDVSRTDFDPSVLEGNNEIFFSVPEDDAVIKKIEIPNDFGLDVDRLALFEFVSSVAGSPGNYFIEPYALNGSRKRLVVGYHRRVIESRLEFFNGNGMKPSGFKLRAWSLAAGYSHFCVDDGEGLTCLVDLSRRSASFAFLERNRPVQIGSVLIDKGNRNDEKKNEARLLSDLAVALKYRLSELTGSSDGSRLSKIVLSGTFAGGDRADRIGAVMKASTVSPRLKRELFSEEIYEKAGAFLVGLGLTVDI